MPDYISVGSGDWVDVSQATRIAVEIGQMTKAAAVSGLSDDGEV